MRPGIENRTFFKRERAAYLVDRFLEFGLVPPTVVREIDGEVGSFQEFISDAKTYGELMFSERERVDQSPELISLFILDYTIFNSDRHGSNLLIKDEKIHAIDNGLAFGNTHLKFEFPRPFNKAVSSKTIDKFDKFLSSNKEQAILKDLLLELLSPKEIDACLARIKFIGELIKNNGTIPFDTKLKFFPNN